MPISKSILVLRQARGCQRLRRERRNGCQQDEGHVGKAGKLSMRRLLSGQNPYANLSQVMNFKEHGKTQSISDGVLVPLYFRKQRTHRG